MATATETSTETVTFISRCHNQVLTRIPPPYVDNGFGGKEVLTEREAHRRATEKGEDFDDTPWRVEFVNHQFTTDHPKLIAWLRQHDKKDVPTASGFWEVDNAPDEPKPNLREQMQAIAQASALTDPDERGDKLADILVTEKETHNRTAVTEAAEAALSVEVEPPSKAEVEAASQTGDTSSTSPPSQPA